MNFEWNPDTIRWYQVANEYSGFFNNIAEVIQPGLYGYSTLCDIGCGLGLIDLELSKTFLSITCIDINQNAIAALQEDIEARKITNIKPLVMDIQDSNECWDVIYVSFFGARELENFLPRCKKLIAVISQSNETALYPEKYKRYHKTTVEEVKERLNNQSIYYTLKELSFDFGQPLLSMEDAGNFVKTHARDITSEDLDSFLTQQLVQTGDKEYPFIIPHMKSVGIFEIGGDR